MMSTHLPHVFLSFQSLLRRLSSKSFFSHLHIALLRASTLYQKSVCNKRARLPYAAPLIALRGTVRLIVQRGDVYFQSSMPQV